MSSFRRRHIQKQIVGTKTSPQTGQVITSSGNLSLDFILGGGLPIGSICLIEEDKYVTHSKVLAKYFLAEGIVSKQAFFFGSLDDDPVKFLHKLPRSLTLQEEEYMEKCSESNKNGMRIAWRYNDLPLVNSVQINSKIGHYFNLMEFIDPLYLTYDDNVTWNGQKENNGGEDDDVAYSYESNNINKSSNKETDDIGDIEPSVDKYDETETPTNMLKNRNIFENEKYSSILDEIQSLLRRDKYVPKTMNVIEKGLCRICITSLGSPLWYDEEFSKDILKFLTILRAMVRSVVSVCIITMPMHLISKYDPNLVSKIRNLVDFSIELESFSGSDHETNPAFQEYHGLVHLHKIGAINTLNAYMPETSDLAFKLKRKIFIIEKLHLPPELQENNNDADNKNAVPTASCGANISPNPKISLDF